MQPSHLALLAPCGSHKIAISLWFHGLCGGPCCLYPHCCSQRGSPPLDVVRVQTGVIIIGDSLVQVVPENISSCLGNAVDTYQAIGEVPFKHLLNTLAGGRWHPLFLSFCEGRRHGLPTQWELYPKKSLKQNLRHFLYLQPFISYWGTRRVFVLCCCCFCLLFL